MSKTNCFSAIKNILNFEIKFERVYELYDFLLPKKVVKTNYSSLDVGDIILWRKNIIPSKGDTGHIAIIDKIIGNGRIRILDYSKLAHSNDDCKRPGLGYGEMNLILEDDNIVGFVWSDEIKKTKITKVLGISPQDLENLL